jgi:hypothetical protein
MIDIDRAVSYMQAHLNSQPTYWCAKHLREALEDGGASISHPPRSAKDYGPILEQLGLRKVLPESYVARRGDVVVVQPMPIGDQNGHVAMFDGNYWISDFRQESIWPSHAFENANAAMTVYRQ